MHSLNKVLKLWSYLKLGGAPAYRWLGHNWEPLVAILALSVSSWSAWISWQSIQLANAGLDVARQAQLDQRMSNESARKPFINLSLDSSGMDITLRNVGPGVARIYQTNIYLPNRVVHIQPPHALRQFTPIIVELVLSTWGEAKVATLSGIGKRWIAGGTPVGTIETNGSLTLVHISPSVKDLIDENDMSKLLENMNIRVCAADSVGKIYAFSFGDDPRLFEDPCTDIPGDYNKSRGRDYNGDPLPKSP